MIESLQQRERLLARFPMLSEATADFQIAFFSHASMVHIPQGHAIATEGSVCGQLALVISGQVRVYKLGESGREITLYRIREGDSCVLSASCIMSDTPFPAIAESETEVDALLVSSSMARDWMSQSKPWCSFIFGLISKRLVDVITVLEEVTFLRMDERVAAYLIALAGQGLKHQITHQQIAADLGTTREVVSRILKTFEGQGYINAARGCLEINNLAALKIFKH